MLIGRRFGSELEREAPGRDCDLLSEGDLEVEIASEEVFSARGE